MIIYWDCECLMILKSCNPYIYQGFFSKIKTTCHQNLDIIGTGAAISRSAPIFYKYFKVLIQVSCQVITFFESPIVFRMLTLCFLTISEIWPSNEAALVSGLFE